MGCQVNSHGGPALMRTPKPEMPQGWGQEVGK